MRIHASLLPVGICSLAACSGAASGDGASASTESNASTNTTSLELRANGQDGPFVDAAGLFGNYSATGSIDTNNLFFSSSLGTNGRACVSCHTAENGFSISPASLQARFVRCEAESALHIKDPGDATACAIFQPSDGANSPNADVSTFAARERSYSLLLKKGLIRIHLPIPEGAEFELVAVDDPYHYASTAGELSLYRRPLPASNTAFAGGMMWDVRDTLSFGEPTVDQLVTQASEANVAHAGGPPLTDDQARSIAQFELSLFSAQSTDFIAGELPQGPVALSAQPFTFGENGDPNTADVFTIYDSWQAERGRSPVDERRASIARGENVFNNVQAAAPLDPNPGSPSSSCSGCHGAFNVGSLPVPITLPNVLVSAAAFRTPDMPLYTFRNKSTGELHRSTDPGTALTSGAWEDLDTFQVPPLRNLAARPPYFHNGSAATLRDVVDRYVEVLGYPYSEQDKEDVVAFLSSL